MGRQLPRYLLGAMILVQGPLAASDGRCPGARPVHRQHRRRHAVDDRPRIVDVRPAAQTYTISGGGENMWAAADHLHYVWKKVSGTSLIEASVQFGERQAGRRHAGPAPQGVPDHPAVARSNAAYADAARHGDGLTSLQWRDTPGAVTHEVQSNGRARPGSAREARQLRVDVGRRPRANG